MGVGHADNAWWLDVLEWGRRSPHAASFDISWELLPYRHGGGVLLPVLGRPYGDALTAGEIELKYDAERRKLLGLVLRPSFPINPQRYSDIIKTVVGAADAAGTPAGRALAGAGRASTDGPACRPTPGAPAFKRRLAAIEGAAADDRARAAAYRADHEAGVGAAASAARAAALPAGRTGGWRRPASTTGGFSTSMSSPGSASRTRARFATSTRWWRG